MFFLNYLLFLKFLEDSDVFPPSPCMKLMPLNSKYSHRAIWYKPSIFWDTQIRPTNMSVSYTHLDVYKRQVLRCVPVCLGHANHRHDIHSPHKKLRFSALWKMEQQISYHKHVFPCQIKISLCSIRTCVRYAPIAFNFCQLAALIVECITCSEFIYYVNNNKCLW